MRRDQQQEEVVLARVPTIQKMLHQHLFLFSRFSLQFLQILLVRLLVFGLGLVIFYLSFREKGRTFLSTWHDFRYLHSSVSQQQSYREAKSPSLPSLDRTNGCEIQSNSRYFRSTVRYNRESNRSNLSAHWFFRICLQFLFFSFFSSSK